MSTDYQMQPATKEDIDRIETTLKEVVHAIRDMVLINERQTVQGVRIGELEKQNASQATELLLLKQKVDSWINRGIGAWAVAGIVWVAFKFFVLGVHE